MPAKKKAPALPEYEQVSATCRLADGQVPVLVQQGRAVVTAAEYAILERIHGSGSVTITAVGEPVERSHEEEKERLRVIYDRGSNRDSQTKMLPVEALFPGLAAPPTTFGELGVKLNAPKIEDAVSVDETLSAKDKEISDLKARLEALENGKNAENATAKMQAKNQAAAKKNKDADDLME